jgi:uncharacterized protein (TIGR04255 family)
MPWNIASQEVERFKRNPLAAVVFQVQYHPILKIKDKVADFQDIVRSRFPMFREQRAREIRFESPETLETVDSSQWEFSSEYRSSIVTLRDHALGIHRSRHLERSGLLDDVTLACRALETVGEPVQTVRVGVRYVNDMDPRTVSAQLGRDVGWSDLVTKEFLHIPNGLADLNDTKLYCEVTSAIEPGAMTLRYGLLPMGQSVVYRLDADRYSGAHHELGSVRALVDQFADQIYYVFRQSAGKELLEWMRSGGEIS